MTSGCPRDLEEKKKKEKKKKKNNNGIAKIKANVRERRMSGKRLPKDSSLK